MKVIGLCGRSGSGKGVISSVFSTLGVPSIDTDAVYRELTAPPSERIAVGGECMRELAEEFGDCRLTPGGGLDRRALSSIVFADAESLAALNRITHKHILRETDRRLESFSLEGYREAIVDAPLLFESGYDKKCDCIIAACAPEEVLIRRITARDGISVRDAERRLSSQLPSDELRERADYIINTDAEIDEILRQAVQILEDIRDREDTNGD